MAKKAQLPAPIQIEMLESLHKERTNMQWFPLTHSRAGFYAEQVLPGKPFPAGVCSAIFMPGVECPSDIETPHVHVEKQIHIVNDFDWVVRIKNGKLIVLPDAYMRALCVVPFVTH